MSLGKAIIGGLLFGTPGFIVGVLLDNDKKEVVNINVKQPTAKLYEQTVEDVFYEKLNDADFESFVWIYCDEYHLKLNDLSNHQMEEMMFEYDEMIEKGFVNA